VIPSFMSWKWLGQSSGSYVYTYVLI
jgi:hypothetical protein